MTAIAPVLAKIADKPAHRFLSCGFIDNHAAWSIEEHLHVNYEMLIFLSGKHCAVVEGKETWSTAGGIVIFPPMAAHREFTEKPAQWIYVHFQWFDRQLDIPMHGNDASGRIRILAEWLLRERDSFALTASQLQNAFFSALLAEYADSFQPKETGMVAQARALMKKNLEGGLSLGKLAKQLNISKYHFLREYARLTGRTPMSDLRLLRLEAARDLLLTTSLPLKAIAPQVGLGDEHSLSRMFRKYLNCTPSSLRSRIRA